MPLPLQACLPADLTGAFPAVEAAEARKLVSAVHRLGLDALPRHAPAGVRRGAFEAVRAGTALPVLTLVERVAADDGFLRYVLAGADGAPFETVRIPLAVPERFSVCVSSQVGCALGCTFCATGRLGLRRNLAAWEIVEQVRRVRGELPAGARVRGVVFQGMGEPLANLDAVTHAVRVLSEPSAQAIDARAITVCTVGLPAGIRRLARELPRVRLGISIVSARPERRALLAPIDRAHPLDDVLAAAADHARATRLAPMWAYTLMAGVNDDPADAAALAGRAAAFAAGTGIRPRLTVVPYNRIDDTDRQDPFARCSPAAEAGFRDALAAAGWHSVRRYSGGGDVGAACGQLGSRPPRGAEPPAAPAR